MIDPRLLLSSLHEDGVQLWVHDGELRYRSPSKPLSPDTLSKIRTQREDIIALLEESAVSRVTPLASQPRPAVLPLSFAQEGLWFLYQGRLVGPAYNFPMVVKFDGRLDLALLERAIGEIVRRHEILRTRFQAVDGIGAQVIDAASEMRIDATDLSCLEAGEQQQRARQLIHLHAEHEFDLEREQPLRLHVLRLGESEHILIITLHHIIEDGRSFNILLDELNVLYAAYRHGKASPLAELSAQYADYSLWQRRWLDGEVLSRQLAYWKARLAGAPEDLGLPTDRSRPATQSYRGGSVDFIVSSALSEALAALARQRDMTLFMILFGAFQVLLSRWSGQKDVIVGVPVEGRGHWQADELIGYFLNTLVMRADLSADPTFFGLLNQVKANLLDAYEHRDLPFTRLVAELRPQRDISRQPLFQVFFAYRGEAQTDLQLPELRIRPVQIDHRTAKFDLTLFMSETGGGLEGGFEYSSDLFERSTIERLAGHFKTLLEAVAEEPGRRISALPLLTQAERRLMLVDWNATGAAFPDDKCIHELFERQVAQTPAAVAVEFEGRQLSYGELNARANQLAHYLRSLGVRADTLVGICMERSLDMVVGLLGILKAGGAYLPLDPEYPQERLAFMLADACVGLLLTQERLKDRLLEHGSQVLCVDQDWVTMEQQPATNLVINTRPLNLAYCVYTSGSTGQPKGAINTHQAFVNLVSWYYSGSMRAQSGEKVILASSLSFDLTQKNIFGPLIVGATLIVPSGAPAAIERFVAALTTYRPTRLNCTPSAYRILVDCAPANALKTVVLGGEPIDAGLAAQLSQQGVDLVNSYGPTECADVAIAYAKPAASQGTVVPLGTPIPNVQVYILDGEYEPVPVGVAGEICIAGVGLARGYLNRPELTAEKFVANPFGEPGSRMYRTGDLGRYLADGNIEFLGRVDRQVKIRGFRVELGEIEVALLRCEGVGAAVVVAREETPADKRLVAYVVCKGKARLTVGELSAQLQASLPGYMVPAAYVLLDALPLNPNGKVDYKALPAPAASRAEAGIPYVAPRTLTEELLAGIWAKVLKVDRVGVNDNFFALGGHSLLATQVVARIKQMLHKDVLLRDFFIAPTLAQLARCLTSAQATVRVRIARCAEPGPYPASFAQQRLWFLEQYAPGTALYNLPAAWRLRGTLDAAALQQSLDEIVSRHEVLRSILTAENGVPLQVVGARGRLPLRVTDLSSEAEGEARARELLREEAERPFELARGPLIRAGLIKLAEDEHILLLTLHHVIADGWSMEVLWGELGTLYGAFSSGQSSQLGELAIQYADFAMWQREWLQGAVLEEHLEFWRRYLEGAPSALALPTDHPRPHRLSHRGGWVDFELGAELSKRLRRLSQHSQATLFMALSAAFNVLLYRYSGQNDICIGYPVASRNRSEIEGLIGFFVNTLVLRTRLGASDTFETLLAQVRASVLEADTHQDLPFEKLVEEMGPHRDVSRNPLFQVVFVLYDTSPVGLQLPGLAVSEVATATATTEFDLTLSMINSDQNLTGTFEYNVDLFDESSINRMVGHFRNLLTAIADSPDCPVTRLPILTAQEQRQLVEWNRGRFEKPSAVCLAQMYEAQAARTPDALAVKCAGNGLSYGELNARANQLAHYLRSLGVRADTLVGICTERSLDMVVGLLGILKAGGAYLPLDPDYPQERLAFMLADAQVHVLLTQASLVERFSGQATHTVLLDSGWHTIASQNSENLPGLNTLDNLAYVIYTSGSTGRPKGVEIPHRGLLNLIVWHQYNYGPTGADRASQLTNLCFDACGWEVWPYLVSGASLHLVGDEMRRSPAQLIQWLAKESITFCFLPTPLAEAALAEQWPRNMALKALLTGGDKLRRGVSECLGFSLVNHYGPTENSVVTTFCEIGSLHSSNVLPIGRPIANTQVYILDRWEQPVPIGVAGELHIAGAGLARGYLKRPDLTAERFIPNPFTSELGSRLYRSGDLGRYLATGVIEFLGRIDDQVKVGGIRIELGEIDAILTAHPEVCECVVAVVGGDNRETQLIAYVVIKKQSQISVQDLRSYLKRKLPQDLIPSAIMLVDSIPLLSNGKVNRHALPTPERTNFTHHDFIPARDATEEALVQIWRDLLDLKQIGIRDNFFDLGGFSLRAMALIVQIRERLGVELPLRTIFESPTIELLAEHLKSALWTAQLSKICPSERVTGEI